MIPTCQQFDLNTVSVKSNNIKNREDQRDRETLTRNLILSTKWPARLFLRTQPEAFKQ